MMLFDHYRASEIALLKSAVSLAIKFTCSAYETSPETETFKTDKELDRNVGNNAET